MGKRPWNPFIRTGLVKYSPHNSQRHHQCFHTRKWIQNTVQVVPYPFTPPQILPQATKHLLEVPLIPWFAHAHLVVLPPDHPLLVNSLRNYPTNNQIETKPDTGIMSTSSYHPSTQTISQISGDAYVQCS